MGVAMCQEVFTKNTWQAGGGPGAIKQMAGLPPPHTPSKSAGFPSWCQSAISEGHQDQELDFPGSRTPLGRGYFLEQGKGGGGVLGSLGHLLPPHPWPLRMGVLAGKVRRV